MSTVTAPLHVMNNYARWPISLVKGKGNQVWDDQGKAYLDFTSGIAVTSLGHVPPKVTAKLHEQLDTLWHCSNLVHIPQQQILAEKLSRLSGLDQAFFCNSGAEANEGLIKLARRYAQKVKGEDRYEVITFAQSFHGRTLATLTATGQDKVKDGFLPLPAGFVTVPYNDLAAVQSAINDKTCAIMLELVQGEGGVHPAEEAWVKSLRDLCDEHGLLLLVDEIQTGIGRTKHMVRFSTIWSQAGCGFFGKRLGQRLPDRRSRCYKRSGRSIFARDARNDIWRKPVGSDSRNRYACDDGRRTNPRSGSAYPSSVDARAGKIEGRAS